MRDSVVFRSTFFQNLKNYVSSPTTQDELVAQFDEVQFEEIEPEDLLYALKQSPPDPSTYIIRVGDTSKKIETFCEHIIMNLLNMKLTSQSEYVINNLWLTLRSKKGSSHFLNYDRLYIWLSFLFLKKMQRIENSQNVRCYSLYHGTDADTWTTIHDSGFDWRYGKKFVYGKGIYLSNSKDVAANYANKQSEGTGSRPVIIECACIVDWPSIKHYTLNLEHFRTGSPPHDLFRHLQQPSNLGTDTTLIKFREDSFVRKDTYEQHEPYVPHGDELNKYILKGDQLNYFIYQDKNLLLPIRLIEPPTSQSVHPTAGTAGTSRSVHPTAG